MHFAQLLFPDFALIVCGYLICRYTQLGRPMWEQVESLVYYVLFPVLLFYSISRSPLDWRAASSLMGAALALAGCAVLLAYSVAKLPGVQRDDFASSAQVGFRFNSYIALALAERLGGQQGLLLIAVIIGVCVPLFNMAAMWPMARHSGQGFGKALLKNPLIVGTLAGLVANVLGISVPAFAEPAVSRIGQASLALGLMAAGAGLQLGEVFNTASRVRAGVALLAVRHLALPLIAVGLVQIFQLNSAQASILLMFSALPTASSCYVLAAKMGLDGTFVAGLVTLSTVLGMLSLPFALSFI
ncbi:AEC family transporter [Variovorax sp. PCZ-1]|uniref:AEC family transporter n=1 Tax=Variovorax sp. PCZ-1 TaxID=2835533 RepID=UPI001BCA68C5|nr:AEC family transporter [Variovorax sp. PCZ-1]MBS7806749.1 AEC family transporter [Variovorax sp. PCZ-1]